MPTEEVSFRELVGHYSAALDRVVAATNAAELVTARGALFETLNWVVTIEDFVRLRWVPEGKELDFSWRERWSGAASLQALRAARNRLQHQWADAVCIAREGRQYRRRYPLRYFEFVWRDLDELPTPPPNHSRPKDDDAYRKHLQGRPVEIALTDVKSVFETLAELLEPPRRHVER